MAVETPTTTILSREEALVATTAASAGSLSERTIKRAIPLTATGQQREAERGLRHTCGRWCPGGRGPPAMPPGPHLNPNEPSVSRHG
jgi:hypothetical protein